MTHDGSYKLLFSHAELVADLLRGFLPPAWVEQLDLASLEKVSGSYVSDDLRDRHNDVVWRLRWGPRWLYVYILLEMQSSVDRFMAVRLLTYVGLLYQDLIQAKQVSSTGKLPAVLPIVLYNGKPRWQAATRLSKIIEPPPAGLESFQPNLQFLLLDEGRYTSEELSALERNLAAALFRLEQSPTLDTTRALLQALEQWLRAPARAGLRRAFTVWLARVLLPLRLPGIELPEMNDLVEVNTMLAERVVEWTEQWKQEGLEKGLKEGLAEGLEKGLAEGLEKGLKQGLAQGRAQGRAEERARALMDERKLLTRLARRRFDAVHADEFFALLELVDDAEQLAKIGEWIIDSDDAEVLLSRVRTLLR